MDMNPRHVARPAGCGLGCWHRCCADRPSGRCAGARRVGRSAAEGPGVGRLETLVGPIALYPDDLVAIILPASTNPLQLVQADRFLDKRKSDPKLAIDDKWDDAVKSLVNYPEVVKKMSTDLDWTTELGEAVVADQGAVLGRGPGVSAQGAVGRQSEDRREAGRRRREGDHQDRAGRSAGGLRAAVQPERPWSSYSSVAGYGYYPAPYPSYYYPYPPGAALATGLIWGAAIGAAWGGGRYGCNCGGGNNNITINRGDVNVNSGNINRGKPERGAVGRLEVRQAAGTGQQRLRAAEHARVRSRAGDARGSAAWRRAGGRRRSPGRRRRPSPAVAGGVARGQSAGGGGRRRRARGGQRGRLGDAHGRWRRRVRRLRLGQPARVDSSRGASSRSSMSGQSAVERRCGRVAVAAAVVARAAVVAARWRRRWRRATV